MKVLITAPYLQPFIERFMDIFKSNDLEIVLPPVKERLEEEELIEIIEEFDGIICGDDRITLKVLSKAKNLKVISKWGTGIDSINKEECLKIGIKLFNTPNAFTIPVSDSILAYILVHARNIIKMNSDMHTGIWNKIPGSALHELTLGVIGVGNIGESVLRKAKAFNMKLLANDIKEIPSDLIIELDLNVVSLEKLLIESDVVSINCDLNPTSFHLINSNTLKFMKKNSFIINTARGPIINEDDLTQYLQSGKIAGAALDVYEIEPLPNNSPLLKMNNVLLASHNSNSSFYAWENVHKRTINNLLIGLNKQILL